MFVDGHRPGRQTVFINFYLLSARFSSLSTSWSPFCSPIFSSPISFIAAPDKNLSVKSSDFLWFTCGDALKFLTMATKVIHLFQSQYKIASETKSKSQAMLRSE
jgi:hypothetical protein